MKFKTQYDEHERVFINNGDKVHILYSSKYDDDGNLVLYEVGRENIPEFINSHAESCDINVIVERFREGDTSALSRRQLLFGDFTQSPKTLADALNTVIAAERTFDSLDPETKKKFGNNFAQWIATMDQVKAAEEMNKAAEEMNKAAAKPEEVSSEGSTAEEQA